VYAIETLRLRLCPMTEEYLDDLVQMWRDPDIMRYLPTGKPRPLVDTQRELEFMIDHWKTYGFGVWRISVKDWETFAGYCGLQHLHVEPNGVTAESIAGSDEIEIMYGVTSHLWSKGIAFEAAKATIRFGFETLKLPRIIAAVHPDNHASRHILEKLGMRADPSLSFYPGCPHFSLDCRSYSHDNAIYKIELLD
jgi:RimJ/RimL family protein N-acetyltransferase